MARIVAGRFDRTTDADAALSALRREGFSDQEVDSFYVGPPGQHAMTPVGGDAPHSSAGSAGAGHAAAIGAGIGAVVGALGGSLLADEFGIVAVVLAAALLAYIGSFAGAMAFVRGGRMIAVNVERAGGEARAIAVLRQHRARDIGLAQGDWRDGSWRDFDPRAPLATV